MAAATVQLLPPEVLEEIFSLILVRPRLRVVAAVCRQWHTIVLRTIKEIPRLSRFPGVTTEIPFPHLTSLNVDTLSLPEDAKVRCPATVRELVCSQDIPRALRKIPPLTSIKFDSSANEPPGLLRVLRKSRTTLQSMHVQLYAGDAAFYVETHHFPALTSLTLEQYLPRVCITHASQLTALSFLFLGRGSFDFLTTTAFPHLVRFAIPTLVNHPALLANSPRLQCLTMVSATPSQLRKLRAVIAPLQLLLQVRTKERKQAAHEAMLCADLPGLCLESFHMDGQPQDAAAILAALHSSRTSLTILSLPNASLQASDVAQFSALQFLHAATLSFDAPLPTLNRLLLSREGALRDAAVVASFPRLTELAFAAASPPDTEGARALAALLTSLDAAGVARMRVTLMAPPGKSRPKLRPFLIAACANARVRVDLDEYPEED